MPQHRFRLPNVKTIVCMAVVCLIAFALCFAGRFLSGKTIKNSFMKGDLHLNYIPDGFSLTEEGSSNKYIHLSFTNGSECFGVSCVPSGTQSYIDTEDATKESVIVNGYEAYWVENPRVRYLIWANDDWMFTIDTDLIGLYQPIKKSTMFKIAKNTQIQ